MRKLILLTCLLALGACTTGEDTAAIQAANQAVPCILAIQTKVASEPTASNEQKGFDAANVATTNAFCLATGTDAASLVSQAMTPAPAVAAPVAAAP